jgi:DNA-binding GntR family transcriptional regulator
MPEADALDRGETTYVQIKRAILALELRPGERISERRLETLLNSSRTPVREALWRLQTEDLVKREGNSWQVTPLDSDEVLEAFDYRCVIELESVRLATLLGTPDEFARLSTILSEAEAQDQVGSFVPRTSMFHVEIARMAQNRFLSRTLIEVLERLMRARMLITLALDTTRGHAEDDHRSIAAAIRSGDPDHAVGLMRSHLGWTRELLLAGMEERRRSTVLSGSGMTLR